MPDITEVDCWDTVVLWPVAGYDDQGQPVRGAPVELTWPNGVRWIPGQTQQMDAKGNLVNLDAQAVVLQEIAIGSQMWLGSLADWFGTGSANTDQEVMVVKLQNRTPSLNGRFDRLTVGLMRYKNV